MKYNFKYYKLKTASITVVLLTILLNNSMASEFNNIYIDTLDYKSNKTLIYRQIKSLPLSSGELQSRIHKFSNSSKYIYLLQLCKYKYTKLDTTNINEILISCLGYFSTEKIEEAIGDCYFYKTRLCELANKADKIIYYNNEAIKHYELANNFNNICISYMMIANHFSRKGNNKYAELYYNNALELIQKENIANAIKNSITINVANHFNKKDEFSKALFYYKELELQLSNDHKMQMLAKVYNNIGVIYLKKQEWPSAQSYLNKSLNLKKDLQDTLGVTSTLLNLLRVSISSKNKTEAKETLNELDSIYGLKIPALEEQILYSYNKIGYYALVGENELIGKELGHYNLLKDSLSNIAFSDKLVEMQKSFEIKERDKNIALLQKEDELKEARLSNQLIVIIAIGAVLLLLIVLGYFINKQRVKLKRSESHLKKQQKRIKQINSDLKTSNLAKDRILSIIGHDLRGPIGGLKELIELYMDMPGYEEEDFKSLLKAAREASTGSYYLLENLLTWANSQNGQIDFKPVTAPLLPLAKTSIDLLDSSINTRNVSFKYDISPAIKLTADLNMLRTIIRNLVSNAVKYSPPESCITISATQNNEETFICIADQGYGMTAEQSSALFEKKETYFIEAGYNAKGSGLGLVLCREFVEQHKGKIWADSVPDKGTKVCFTIPLNIEHLKTTGALHKHTPAMN